jgi:hypothetical protein
MHSSECTQVKNNTENIKDAVENKMKEKLFKLRMLRMLPSMA